MGTLADSLFNVLMGWVRALVNGIWALFTTDHTTLLEFLGKNWIMIVVVILAAGLAIDWLVWLIRWRPLSPVGQTRAPFPASARTGGGRDGQAQKAPGDRRGNAEDADGRSAGRGRL